MPAISTAQTRKLVGALSLGSLDIWIYMDLCKDPQVPPELAAKYEREAGRYWDLFYQRNETKFFRDRHYFGREFPQLLVAQTVLEVGCGVGNSVFPLLELNPSVRLFACDFAATAVALVKQHPLFEQYSASGRLHAFEADITRDDLTASVPPASVDVCTMIFCLSAVTPDAMPRALRSVARTLRPGGQLLFRDYAVGDLAEDRFAEEGRQQRLGANCYVRWDGTIAYYFTEEGLRQLFESEGFRCDSLRQVDMLVENRKRGERMDRRFLQAVFTYAGSSSSQLGGRGQSSSGGSGAQSGELGGSLRGGSSSRATQQQACQLATAHEELQETEVCLGSSRLKIWCRPPGSPPGSDSAAAAATAAGAADRAAAEALAAAVLRCPSLTAGADVLELCGWDAPLAALAALRWCRRAVAAGSSAGGMQLLRRNARLNGCRFIIERLRLAQLEWYAAQQQQQQRCGCGGLEDTAEQQGVAEQRKQQQQQVQRAFPCGFHAVLAAVPAAASAEDLQQLLCCAAALLSWQPGAAVLICTADPAAAQQAAVAAQLEEAALPDELAAADSTKAAPAAAAAAAAAAADVPTLHLLQLQRNPCC